MQTYTIGELAQEFDLTTRAIRFYEDLGLLAPERGRPAAVYSARDRARLLLTLRAKRLGLSLTEAKDILDMYDSPRDTAAAAAALPRRAGRATGPSSRRSWPSCRPTSPRCARRRSRPARRWRAPESPGR